MKEYFGFADDTSHTNTVASTCPSMLLEKKKSLTCWRKYLSPSHPTEWMNMTQAKGFTGRKYSMTSSVSSFRCGGCEESTPPPTATGQLATGRTYSVKNVRVSPPFSLLT